jgi:capsular exopolysaccharide synthesis family protein
VYPYDDETGGQPPLRRLAQVVRRRWLAVTVVTVLTLGAAFAYGLTRPDEYAATSEILVRGTSTASQPGASQALSANPERLMETELELIESRSTRASVEQRSGESISVSAEALGDSDVIEVRLQGDDPDVVVAQLSTFTDTYLDLRRQDEVDSLRTQLEGKQQSRRGAQRDLREARAPLQDMDARLAALPPGPERDVLQQQRDALALQTEPRIGSLQSYVGSLDGEIRELQDDIAAAGGGLALISQTESAAPVNPSPARSLLVGGLVGVLAGVGVAFVREQFDDSIRNPQDLERTVERPVLGIIPRQSPKEGWGDVGLVMAGSADSASAEAYRNLATSLGFVMRREDAQVLEITSPAEGEGKTTVVANVGAAFARTGQRVVIVDADFRRHRLNGVFGLGPSDRGLATALLGEHDPLDAIITLETDLAGAERSLGLLPAGSAARSPVELLESPETPKVLARLKEEATVVIIDTPPVLPVADALVLAQHVDATVLVCAARATGRDRMTQAVAALRGVEAPLLGTILNKVTREAGYGNYGYYDEPGRRRRR